MSIPSPRIRGRLCLEVRSTSGSLEAVRHAENIVLRQGAAVVAALLAGKPNVRPITHVMVGFGRETAEPEATSLTPPGGEAPAPPEALRSPVSEADFSIVADQPDLVQVRATTVFRPSVELPDVSEAGLVAGETLYNQVVFEPITLRVGQTVSLFWEIDFPFGHG